MYAGIWGGQNPLVLLMPNFNNIDYENFKQLSISKCKCNIVEHIINIKIMIEIYYKFFKKR